MRRQSQTVNDEETAHMGSTKIAKLVGLMLLFALTGCVSAPSAPSTSTTEPARNDPTPTATSKPPSPTPEPPLAAEVNGEPIYLSEYEQELGQYEASLEAQGIDPESEEGQENLNQAQKWILNVMIEQKLMEQAAEKAGITVTEEDVNGEMEAMIAESGSEEAFRAQLEEWGETYEEARREVRAQLIGMAMTERVLEGVPEETEHVHARHILVDTKEEAERLHAQLEAGADFAELAKAHSQDDSTRESGGDLGFFPRGILVATEVEEAAFALQPGQFSEVISSSMGYHIVQVIERDSNRPVSSENLRILQDRAIQEWVKSLWAQADVKRFIDSP
jgi:parvulin-like peptidyl-prolyl isomerase